MKRPADAAPEEPVRVRVHTSLIERPFFGGVDFEFWLIAAFLIWSSFLVFHLALPFWLVLALCVGLYHAMRRANARDQFFLPILVRSLLYRRRYAARPGPTDVGPARPSLPPRALPS